MGQLSPPDPPFTGARRRFAREARRWLGAWPRPTYLRQRADLLFHPVELIEKPSPHD
jgi:hypothetical protein